MMTATLTMPAIYHQASKHIQTEEPIWQEALASLTESAKRMSQYFPESASLSQTTYTQKVLKKLERGVCLSKGDRRHFIGLACCGLRQIATYCDQQRQPRANESFTLATLDQCESLFKINLHALETALDKITQNESRLVKLVEFRYFGGLSREACAKVLGVSLTALDREWFRARTLLFHALRD